MVKKAPRRRSKPSSTAASKAAPPRTDALLDASDIRMILLEQANRVAPADVATLMASEHQLRGRAARLDDNEVPWLREQVNLALDCLRDHVDGLCPQIPYYTVSLLAAAVSYFAAELDIIPDFLPEVGRLDDAVVMAMACRLGHDGLRRYCDWRGRDAEALLGPSGGPHPR